MCFLSSSSFSSSFFFFFFSTRAVNSVSDFFFFLISLTWKPIRTNPAHQPVYGNHSLCSLPRRLPSSFYSWAISRKPEVHPTSPHACPVQTPRRTLGSGPARLPLSASLTQCSLPLTRQRTTRRLHVKLESGRPKPASLFPPLMSARPSGADYFPLIRRQESEADSPRLSRPARPSGPTAHEWRLATASQPSGVGTDP